MPRKPKNSAVETVAVPKRTANSEIAALLDHVGLDISDPDLPAEEPAFPHVIPLLPIRDQVYFPHMIFPLLVGREKSVRALDEAIAHGKQIMLVTQKRVQTEDPTPDELYAGGIVAEIMQILRVPDGTVRVMPG